MVAEMLAQLKNEKKVKKALQRLFPRRKDHEIESLLEEGRKHVVIDHLKLK